MALCFLLPSHLRNVDKAVYTPDAEAFKLGASLKVVGTVVPSRNESVEINAKEIVVLGTCPADYPLQKKRHTLEFMRTMPHLRTRTMDFLKDTVTGIVSVMADTQEKIKEKYPCIKNTISKDVFFVTSQELEDMYPCLSAKERENLVTKEYKTVFIMQIGKLLKSGTKHDGRAPDYDDWELNGDIMVWNDVLDSALELSSMGIRVDAQSLKSQLEASGSTDRMKFNYHKGIANGTLPLTIGGGIGQSRLCMFMLEKAHIGEVQVSVWPEDMIDECKRNDIILL